MSGPGIQAIVDLKVRWILQRDLKSLWQMEELLPGLRWSLQDFRTVFQSPETGGLVAEKENRLVAYLIYRVTWQLSFPWSCQIKSAVTPCYQKEAKDHVNQPLHITLLNLGVAPDWHRRGIGRALLERISQKLKQPQDWIEATVPESNFPVQFLLRRAGFKAKRVLRGYYGSEDGYLMELPHSG